MPSDIGYKIYFTKNFVTNFAKIVTLVIINRYKYYSIFFQKASCHHQPRINHRAPIRMVSTIRICILTISITQFIHISSGFIFLFLRTSKVIMIHEVIPRIIRRIDVNHLHLTKIRLLEQFQHFKVVALNI